MNQLPPDILSIVVPIAIVLLSLTVHEAAHAWTADRLGDPTARLLGRVSFNPIVHIDPIGTILLPLLAALSNLPIIGWAKPVPVNTSRLRHPQRDFMVIAAAGPASNILLAVLGAAAIAITATPSYGSSPLLQFVEINILLAMFNLVPVPPLDGGNVLAGLLPPAAAQTFDRLRPFGFIILYAMMFTGILNALIMPPARLLWGILIP
ncbi:MAG TPA: site-2 protease family protein [Vicinamibacterales bacterium]